jgi:hypothetical protein
MTNEPTKTIAAEPGVRGTKTPLKVPQRVELAAKDGAVVRRQSNARVRHGATAGGTTLLRIGEHDFRERHDSQNATGHRGQHS